MIENLFISLLIAFANPADISGKSMYPSGAKDIDKFFPNAPVSSNIPLLKLFNPCYGYQGTIIQPGIYETDVSADEKYILLKQSRQLVNIIPVKNVVSKENAVTIPVSHLKQIDEKEIEVKYINLDKEYTGTIHLLERTPLK